MSLHGDVLVEPVESVHALESVHLQDISSRWKDMDEEMNYHPYTDTDAGSNRLS
jgi:hypothetical protein